MNLLPAEWQCNVDAGLCVASSFVCSVAKEQLAVSVKNNTANKSDKS
jgi:hypothetical protein